MQKCKTKNNLLTPISFHIGTQTNQTNKRDKKNSKVFFKDLNISGETFNIAIFFSLIARSLFSASESLEVSRNLALSKSISSPAT